MNDYIKTIDFYIIFLVMAISFFIRCGTLGIIAGCMILLFLGFVFWWDKPYIEWVNNWRVKSEGKL
jgi:hypothetical protein